MTVVLSKVEEHGQTVSKCDDRQTHRIFDSFFLYINDPDTSEIRKEYLLYLNKFQVMENILVKVEEY